eukprot:CAMPEP_0117578920 /NCGR_PEP_ID=MMETSP0784-20121206/64314_1 /TAXON_ID=39447 /ORGANISM="" /LENGTH=43 /DNA_ID= /DNA_START= /DNA_END= /DNA_ORIENTATION=
MCRSDTFVSEQHLGTSPQSQYRENDKHAKCREDKGANQNEDKP